MSRNAVAAALVVAAAALCSGGCKMSLDGAKDANAAIPGSTPRYAGKGEYAKLKTGKVDKGDVVVKLPEVGSLAPIVQVDVKSPLSGRIIALKVKEGDHVDQGQALATLEPSVDQLRDLSAIASGVSSADIELKDAKIDFDNTTALSEKGYASNDQLKAAAKRLQQAQINYDAAVAQRDALASQGVPVSGDAAAALRQFTVTAPSAGVVLTKSVEPGETVTSGTSSFNGGTVLFTIADAKALKVTAFVNEVDLGKIAVGYPAKITVDAFRGQEFKGEVSSISPAAHKEGEVSGFNVEIRLLGDTGPLRPGMTANVDITGQDKKDVVRVPVEALMKDKGDDVVWIIDDKGQPARRQVTPGLISLDWVEIPAGLNTGMDIALESPSSYLEEQKEKLKQSMH